MKSYEVTVKDKNGLWGSLRIDSVLDEHEAWHMANEHMLFLVKMNRTDFDIGSAVYEAREILPTDKPIRHLPYKWCQLKKITIVDPDGWREDGKSWNAPITEEEFEKRKERSTIMPTGGKSANVSNVNKQPEVSPSIEDSMLDRIRITKREVESVTTASSCLLDTSLLMTIARNQIEIMEFLVKSRSGASFITGEKWR